LHDHLFVGTEQCVVRVGIFSFRLFFGASVFVIRYTTGKKNLCENGYENKNDTKRDTLRDHMVQSAMISQKNQPLWEACMVTWMLVPTVKYAHNTTVVSLSNLPTGTKPGGYSRKKSSRLRLW
jgi:hypothetical protein